MIATLAAAAMSLAASASSTDRLVIGSIDLTPCEVSRPRSATTSAAWCAPFEVPENRAEPGGRKLALRLAVIKADGAPDADPVVLLAGGPGQAATESWASVQQALIPLQRHRHVILLDQRGTGGSNPLACPADKDGSSDTDFNVDRARDLARRCLESLKDKADPRYYTTSDAVDDLEALRVALGGVKYNLVGISYGTRVAQQYMTRHPEGVRSVVLDGVAPNELAFGADFARNLDDALKARFALCAKDAACNKRFGDIYKTLYDTRAKFAREPVQVSIRDPGDYSPRQRRLDGDLLSSLVRLFAYSPETASLLPLVISEAAAGNTAPLVGQAEFVTQELAAGMTAGMGLSVVCSEDVDLAQERPEDASLILGGTFVQAMHAQCEVWPKGKRPDDFHRPVKSDLPVLLLSGEYDPVTPPRYGDAVLKGLAHGRHLVALGQGHNVIGRGCLPRVVKRFVETLETDTLEAGCIADMGPAPFFLDYNGASP